MAKMSKKYGPKISTYNGRQTQHVYCNAIEKVAKTGRNYAQFVGTFVHGGRKFNVVLSDMGMGVVGESESGQFIKVDISERVPVRSTTTYTKRKK